MKSKYIIFLILLSFAATILISCSNKNEASSKSESQDGGIILSDRFYAIHGVVTKIINENTVILKITESEFDKTHENKEFKVVFDGGFEEVSEKDGTPISYKFEVGDKAYFKVLGGEFEEDDNGRKILGYNELNKRITKILGIPEDFFILYIL